MCQSDQKNYAYVTFFATLHLYDYEAYFKTDKPEAIKFKNAFHFFDYECNLNYAGQFSIYHRILDNRLEI